MHLRNNDEFRHFLWTFAFQNQTKSSRFVKRVTKMSGAQLVNPFQKRLRISLA